MTSEPETRLALRQRTELAIQQTSLVKRGLELADFALARFDVLAAAEQVLPVWQQIGIEMISIPAGPFLMGRNENEDVENEDVYSTEREFPQHIPRHIVDLPAFCIGRVPVTNEQYKLFVNAMGYYNGPEHWRDGHIPAGKEKHPVVNVAWDEAQAFCAWAGVRLPTEAEWEKAARSTDGRVYPWGDDPPTENLANFNRNVDDTTPVDSYPKGASPYGVLDMAGNVWEWTNSRWGDDLFTPDYGYPYDSSDGREDMDVSDLRVVRGGAFSSVRQDVRCATRFRSDPSNALDFCGFRVALSSSSS